MAIPDFDQHGNLPPGRHEATVEEVRDRLVTPFEASATRGAIFEWWRHHRDALTELIEIRSQWLAGSFASDKPEPADVDVITVLDGPAYDDLPRHRQVLIRTLIAGHTTEALWGCDSYPLLTYPDDHPGAPASKMVGERYLDYFASDRDNHERGLVEVTG